MLKIPHIKSIETGHRQLTFGFDDNLQEDKLVMSCVKDQIKNCGHAVLDEIVTHIQLEHGIDEIFILQNIFWSARELKIHLRADSKNITPLTAKKILLDSPDKQITIIANKSVPDLIFQKMVCFYNKLFSPDKPVEFADQYEFSRTMLRVLEKWESDIASHQVLSKKKFYPGERIINKCLMVLSQVLGRQDSYSLILACYENQDKIIEMAEDVHIISKFYSNHSEFWELLIQSIGKFDVNLEKIKQNPQIFSAFNNLTRIVALPEPYNEITKAKENLKIVQEHNDFIEQEELLEHQRKTIFELDLMIEKLKTLFQKNNSDPDFCNTHLYELRKIRIKLEHAKTIKTIDFEFANVQDMYDDVRYLL